MSQHIEHLNEVKVEVSESEKNFEQKSNQNDQTNGTHYTKWYNIISNTWIETLRIWQQLPIHISY